MNIVTNVTQLRNTTEEVKGDEDISEIVANLFEGLKEHHALGLSANQLGYNKRIFVMVMNPYPPVCVVNPVLTKKRGCQLGVEPCLSLPGITVTVKRPQQVVIKGENQYRNRVKYKLSGQQARIACHELNHLAGKLITDYKS